MDKPKIYVDPRICLHMRLKYSKISGNFLIVKCLKCGLAGNPVKIGLFLWWAKSRATRQFYRTALVIDEVGND